MLKNKSKFIAIFMVIILLFMTSFVFAENDVTTQNPTDANTLEVPPEMPIDISDEQAVSADETLQGDEQNQLSEADYKTHDVYLSGGDIRVGYVVDGNLFIMSSGTVTISSQIAGDVFICAKSILIDQSAYISGNLFSVSDYVDIMGIVYDTFSVAKNFNIYSGYVYRDLRVVCEQLNIYGTVGRNAFATASSISFHSETTTSGLIYGDLNYTSSSKIDIPEDVVAGNVNYTPSTVNAENNISTYMTSLGSFLVFVIVLWALGMWLTPKFMNHSNHLMKHKKLFIILSGILGIILIPVICILLLLIPITVSISFLLGALFFSLIAISKSVFTITLNNCICKKLNVNKNLGIFGALIITSIVVWALCLIPYNIGFVISIITMILGLGIILTPILSRKSISDSTNDDETSSIKKEKKEMKKQAKASENKKNDDTNIDKNA